MKWARQCARQCGVAADVIEDAAQFAMVNLVRKARTFGEDYASRKFEHFKPYAWSYVRYAVRKYLPLKTRSWHTVTWGPNSESRPKIESYHAITHADGNREAARKRRTEDKLDFLGFDPETEHNVLVKITVERILSELGDTDRSILVDHSHGYTFTEIGRKHGFSKQRGHQALYRAREAARRIFGDDALPPRTCFERKLKYGSNVAGRA
jgi:RNA polymerase sigma factor (sigma-70 family)